ncbi:MAG: AAA family ATPase, partial [Actinomycetota bacterium]
MSVRWDGFELDVAAHRLTGPEGDIHVEPQVFDVLAMLVDQRHRIVTKSELLDQVWGDQFVSESALTTRIKQARKSLGDDGRTQRYIRNVHGRGYQFVGEIEERSATADGDQTTNGGHTGGARTPTQTQTGVTGDAEVDLAREIAVDADFPFVGRSSELEQATELLSRATGGATAVFAGRPGVGKSRLAVEVATRAAANGALVGAGRCERRMTSSLQPVRDLVGQLAIKDPGAVAGWADGVEGPLLSLIPSLANHLADHQPTPVDAYAGIDVFLTVLDRLSTTRPLILLIDDLQWSDEPTRALLDRLGRRLPTSPIDLILTHRTGRSDLPPEVEQWLRRRARASETVAVELTSLDDDSARGLIEAVLEDASTSDVDELLAVTDANCLFLTETLRDAAFGRAGAQSVAELIAARLDRQDDEVTRIITAGAALGSEFPFSVAAEAAGLDQPAALAAIDRAIDAELIHETSAASRFRFSHQLVPESIVDRLGRADRVGLHQRCAQALAAAGAEAAQIVIHELRAVPLVPLDTAVANTRAAAAAARAATEYDLALRLLSLAVEAEPPARVRAEIRLEQAWVLNDLGTPAQALEMVDEVVGSARANGWPDLVIEGALAHWSQSPYRRPSDTSTLALLAEAAELAGDAESVTRALVLAKTAAFSVFTRRLAVRGAMAEEALAMATRVGAPDLDILAITEMMAITNTCPAGFDRLDELDPEIVRLRQSTGRPYFRDAAAPETLAMARGRGDEFRLHAGRDPKRVAAQPIAEWRQLTLDGTLAAFGGDLDAARDGYDRAAEIGEAYWGESSH